MAELIEKIQKIKNVDKLFNKDKISEDEFKETYYFKVSVKYNTI